jgi:hypothetical protein
VPWWTYPLCRCCIQFEPVRGCVGPGILKCTDGRSPWLVHPASNQPKARGANQIRSNAGTLSRRAPPNPRSSSSRNHEVLCRAILTCQISHVARREYVAPIQRRLANRRLDLVNASRGQRCSHHRDFGESRSRSQRPPGGPGNLAGRGLAHFEPAIRLCRQPATAHTLPTCARRY